MMEAGAAVDVTALPPDVAFEVAGALPRLRAGRQLARIEAASFPWLRSAAARTRELQLRIDADPGYLDRLTPSKVRAARRARKEREGRDGTD